MVNRVAVALVWHELVERARDRWVLVISILFALLASGVGAYGRSAGAEAGAALTGPSLVTLVSLLVPLVAVVLGHDAIVGERERNTLGMLLSMPVSRLEVVMAKFIGRALALLAAVTLGLGAAALTAGPDGAVLWGLLLPSWLLGIAFLAVGLLISSMVKRQATATSLVVAIWFIMVLFWDLGLLGLLVVTDGAVGQDTIAWMTFVNPAGLFRVEMMAAFGGPEVLETLGLIVPLPGKTASAGLWAAWVAVPVLGSAGMLAWRRTV